MAGFLFLFGSDISAFTPRDALKTKYILMDKSRIFKQKPKIPGLFSVFRPKPNRKRGAGG